MSVNALSTNVTVSGQIHVSDLSFLSDQNVEVIVCNRPDHEDNPQPTFAEIAQRAESLGMEAHHIPFSGGDFSANDVQALKEILAAGKKIHLYCRSGNRSSILWKAATA